MQTLKKKQYRLNKETEEKGLILSNMKAIMKKKSEFKETWKSLHTAIDIFQGGDCLNTSCYYPGLSLAFLWKALYSYLFLRVQI